MCICISWPPNLNTIDQDDQYAIQPGLLESADIFQPSQAI